MHAQQANGQAPYFLGRLHLESALQERRQESSRLDFRCRREMAVPSQAGQSGPAFDGAPPPDGYVGIFPEKILGLL